MKQSTFSPLTSTRMAIRFSYNNKSTNNSGGRGGMASNTGVAYVLQPPGVVQGKPQGVLRPVSFVPQQHQQQQPTNGRSQVVIQRFPTDKVVQVRRFPSMKQVPVQGVTLTHKQNPDGSGETGGNSVLTVTTTSNHEVVSEIQPKTEERFQLSGSESDSNEYGEGDSKLRRCSRIKNKPSVDEEVSRQRGLKRKLIQEEEEDGDLLVDEDLDEQEGDVIDDYEEQDEEKTALELNGAGVDTGFLRHVIETQILNRHKTRIEDWDGTKGHMCQSCHETFLTEIGLENHRNRHIHHIFFYCSNCKRDLSFFNKCRLLQHLRNHRVTPTVTSLQNCVMIRLLPESDYLHFRYEDCTSSSEDEDDHSGGSAVNNGGVSSSSNGGSIPSKRLKPKPSRFRRIARSNIAGRDTDTSPPPPNVSRQIVQPPQLSSPQSTIADKATTAIVSTINNASTSSVPATVFSDTPVTCTQFFCTTTSSQGDSGLGEEGSPPKSSQETNVVTAMLPVSTAGSNLTNGTDPNPRIRNLSQITVSVNEDERLLEEFDDKESEGDKLEIAPVIAPLSISTQKTSQDYCCYKCDQSFHSAADFFKHLQDAEQVGLSSRSLHRCPTDDIPSWSQCQYVFHTKVFHEKSAPFLCLGCGVENSSYNALLEHVTNDCFYLSQRVRYMCAATAVLKCSFSDRKSVKTEPEIIDHLKKEHSRSVLQCLQCTQGFATENWLLKHLVETHGIHLDESKGVAEREALIAKTTRPLTQCLICNILFPNGPTYLQHVYLNFHVHIHHAKMLECQNCLCVFETHEELHTHRIGNDKCKKLDPFSMKITAGAVEDGDCSKEKALQLPPIPTSSSVAIHPSSTGIALSEPCIPVVTKIPQNASPSGTAAENSNSSVNGVVATQLSPQISSPKSQSRTFKPTSRTVQVSTAGSQIPKTVVSQSIDTTCQKKSAFDEIRCCQFCSRYVSFFSLRKHEDQCGGLCSINPAYCLTCKNYFGDHIRLARHGIQHLSDGVPICLLCNNRHIRPTHPKSTTPTAQENLFALKKHLYSNHTSKIVHFPWKCTICSTWLPDKRASEFHIKDHQFKYQQNPSSSHEESPTPVPVSEEELQNMVKMRRKCLDPKRKIVQKTIEVYYCPVCKNREFAMEAGLSRHLKLVHQKNPKSLDMSLLRKVSTARRFVVKASDVMVSTTPMVRETQGNKPVLRSGVNSSAIANMTVHSTAAQKGGATVTVSSASSTNSFTSRFSSNIVLRKRLTPTRPQGIASIRTPPISRQRITSTNAKTSSTTSTSRSPTNFLQTRSASKSCRLKDGTIVCFKCPNFASKSETDFCEHVKWKHVWPHSEIEKLKFGNKLDEPSEYWCPECDTMFVAKATLVRHLKFAHDYIKNAEEYMQKIGYDGKKPVQPHQCDVCYYQCKDDRELQQHIRTHGMAFLRLRQQRQVNISAKTLSN